MDEAHANSECAKGYKPSTAPVTSGRSAGGKIMWDFGCLIASVVFFAIAIGYTAACERLGTKEKQ